MDEIEILFKTLDLKIYRISLITSLSTNLCNYRLGIKNEEKILKDAKKSINDNLKTYEDLLIKSEICPFCLSNINENKIEHIIKHYS